MVYKDGVKNARINAARNMLRQNRVNKPNEIAQNDTGQK